MKKVDKNPYLIYFLLFNLLQLSIIRQCKKLIFVVSILCTKWILTIYLKFLCNKQLGNVDDKLIIWLIIIHF